jgi:glycosyltransferase involved in cell wall biosynthesis
MFCSTIIPTVGRSTLGRAVMSVLGQASPDRALEVIVVNDTGAPLAAEDWMGLDGVTLLTTQRHERSVARNTGAAVARGRYLHFLDDDDLMLPGAMAAFAALAQASDAPWLYGSYQSVDNHGRLLQEFCPQDSGNIFPILVAGEGIPFQASLLERGAFFAAGMFDPLIIGVEDRDLGRRIALGGGVAKTAAVVAQIRVGQMGSTTNWATIAEDDRWGREKALRDQRAFARLFAGAESSYLCGRISRSYLASMSWNLRRNHVALALERGASALAFALRAAPSPEFWRGLHTRIG